MLIVLGFLLRATFTFSYIKQMLLGNFEMTFVRPSHVYQLRFLRLSHHERMGQQNESSVADKKRGSPKPIPLEEARQGMEKEEETEEAIDLDDK